MTLAQSTVAPVRRTVVVNAPQAHAFAVFTEHLAEWWPLTSYHIGRQPAATAILEPHAGGRWFERAEDGSECDWGRVLTWEPPHRLVLSWDINADWTYQPGLGSEVEVRFIAEGPQSTRVELEHRHLERFAERAAEMRTIFESDGGWNTLLGLFVERASKR
jgi:uncharacterized protein YndB with AHSA1/START domain